MTKRSVMISLGTLLTACLMAPHANAAAPQRVVVPNPATGPSLSGKVIVPVTGFWDYIDVILEYETGVPVGYTHTDTAGTYAFYNLMPGRYFVLIELDGFEQVRERVDIDSRDPPAVRPIFLTPLAPKSSSGAATVNVDLRRKFSKKAIDEFEKAQEDMGAGDLQKAAQHLTASLKEAPTFFEARSLLGTVYHKMRRYTDAEVEYRKARDLNPQAVLPLVNLGTLYLENAEAERDQSAVARLHKGAYDVLMDATKLDPRSAMATFLLGVASYRSSRIEEAETHLKRALELNSRMGQAQVMLANVYIKQQNWPSALETLNAYLRDHQDAPDASQIAKTRSAVAERVNPNRK